MWEGLHDDIVLNETTLLYITDGMILFHEGKIDQLLKC